MKANVTDPNSYTFTEGSTVGTVPAGSQGVNCLAEWFPGEFPEGRTFSCDDTEKGYWAIQVFSSSSSGELTGTDFKVKFIHSAEPGQLIAAFRARIEGEAEFKSGTNGTTNYGCFSSGSCNAGLKPEGESSVLSVSLERFVLTICSGTTVSSCEKNQVILERESRLPLTQFGKSHASWTFHFV